MDQMTMFNVNGDPRSQRTQMMNPKSAFRLNSTQLRRIFKRCFGFGPHTWFPAEAGSCFQLKKLLKSSVHYQLYNNNTVRARM